MPLVPRNTQNYLRPFALQRVLPLGPGGRTHADWNQAVVVPCNHRRLGWPLFEAQRSEAIRKAVRGDRRRLPHGSNW